MPDSRSLIRQSGTRYRTIVIDPPWAYRAGTGLSLGEKDRRGGRRGAPRQTKLPYSMMSLDEIAALPVSNLADAQAHLYLWTTQRYLWDAKRIAGEWGFRVGKVLVWCKPPAGMSLGDHYGSACEFVLFAHRGGLKVNRKVPRDWFEWPRRGGHSAKPEAFLDMVEQVSPGPYLEMFARRARFGWDYYGDQSLGTAELPEAAA